MYSSAFGFFMNEEKWNKLPKQDQDAIDKISGEWIARHAGQSWDEADKKGLEVLKKGSEEHTSELQSHSELVCRLLLEKKKRVSATPQYLYGRHLERQALPRNCRCCAPIRFLAAVQIVQTKYWQLSNHVVR